MTNKNVNSKTYGYIAAAFCFLAAILFLSNDWGLEVLERLDFFNDGILYFAKVRNCFAATIMLFYAIALCSKKVTFIIPLTVINIVDVLLSYFFTGIYFIKRYVFEASFVFPILFSILVVISNIMTILQIISVFRNDATVIKTWFIPGMFYAIATSSYVFYDASFYYADNVLANLLIAIAYFAIGMMNKSMVSETISNIYNSTTNCNVESRKINAINVTEECESVKKLKEIKNLFDAGAITQEEFNAKKKEILEK